MQKKMLKCVSITSLIKVTPTSSREIYSNIKKIKCNGISVLSTARAIELSTASLRDPAVSGADIWKKASRQRFKLGDRFSIYFDSGSDPNVA